MGIILALPSLEGCYKKTNEIILWKIPGKDQVLHVCRIIFQEYPKSSWAGLLYNFSQQLCGKMLLHKWINIDGYFYIHAGMI